MRQYNPCLIFLKIFSINIFFSYQLKPIFKTHYHIHIFIEYIKYITTSVTLQIRKYIRNNNFLFEINYSYSGLCHQGAFKLPSGKWLCVVNDEIKKDYYEGQQFCEDNGFERLFEVRSPEDSQFTNKLEFCEQKNRMCFHTSKIAQILNL